MDLTAISSIVINSAVMFAGVIIIGTVLVFIIRAYLQWKRFKYVCIIVEKDGFGQPQLDKDKAGIYVDAKTKNKRFFLKKSNVGLDPDNVPYIKNEKGQKVVFLKRTGLKNFQFISWENFFEEVSSITVGEEDVNWAINAYERQKALFGTTLLMKLLPYLALIIMGVFILGMIAVLLQKFEILADIAEHLASASASIAQAESGTTVIQ